MKRHSIMQAARAIMRPGREEGPAWEPHHLVPCLANSSNIWNQGLIPALFVHKALRGGVW